MVKEQQICATVIVFDDISPVKRYEIYQLQENYELSERLNSVPWAIK